MILIIIANIILNLCVGFSSSYALDFETSEVFLSPPRIVFPFVWGILYIILGIYVGMISSEISIFLYYIMMSLNFLWSVIYFGIKNLILAAIIIIGMIGLTLTLMIIEDEGRWYLLPYIIWLCFAVYLNIATIISPNQCRWSTSVTDMEFPMNRDIITNLSRNYDPNLICSDRW